MKTYVLMHIQGKYTEDEICKTFNISHARFRREHPNPPELLSWGAMKEIKAHRKRSPERLAEKYKTTVGQIYRALRQQPNVRIPVDQDKVKDHAKQGLSKEDIAEAMGISLNQVRRALAKKRTSELRDYIRASLKTGLYTQLELAEELGITQSTVSYYAEEGIKRPNRPKLTVEQWKELLDKLPNSSVSELSREYNVSRAAIYRRLK